jgi:autotransporter-associated beta strand protein
MLVGNSSGTTGATGTLRLTGATVNSVANTVIRNNSSQLFTIQNTQGAGNQTMALDLGNATNNIIQIDGTGGVAISSNITGTNRPLSRQGVGTGSLTLSGDNSGWSGGISYSGLGALALQHSNAAGIGTINMASTQAGTAATLTVTGGINVANDIILDAATGRNTLNNLSGSNQLTGNVTINGNSGNIVAFNNSASSGSNTTYTIGAATPNSTTISAATYSNAISFRSSSNGELVVLNSRVTAPNALFDVNNNAFVTVNSSGNDWAVTRFAGSSSQTSRIVLGQNNALATGARVEMGGAGGNFLDLNGYNQTVAGLAGSNASGSIRNNSTTADSTLTLAGLTENRSYSGSITDGSGDRKTSLVINNGNAFTQTLSGTNTYTGDTLVSAGTLLVNGSLGNTAVSVTGTATIGGTGTIGGSLDLAATAFFHVANINNPLAVTGTVTFGSGFGFGNLTGIDWDAVALETPFTLISTIQTFGTGDIAHFGFDNRVSVGSLGREAYFTNGSLAIVVIPEPGAVLLGGIGVLTLLRRRRS